MTIGATVAGLELLSSLGTTRVGELFLGECPDGRCIVKLLRAELCGDRARVDRALAAAGQAGALDHRGIEFVIEAGWDGDRAYQIGDIVPGASAAELVARRVFEPESARSLLRLAADALAVAHDAGIHHGALDARSIYVGYASDRIQVRDFGMAELVDALAAPSAAADVLALGRIGFELLHGAPPGPALEIAIATSFDALIARMLADDPALRPTMAIVRDALGGKPRPIPRDVQSVMSAIAVEASDEVTPPPGEPPTST